MAQKQEKKKDNFVVNFMLGGVAGAISKVCFLPIIEPRLYLFVEMRNKQT